MISGDVAHEGAGDFFVAHAAMEPAQEDDELHDTGTNAVSQLILDTRLAPLARDRALNYLEVPRTCLLCSGRPPHFSFKP